MSNLRNPIKSIVLPSSAFGIINKPENYWAMFYYAIIKTLRYQITISVPWTENELSLSEYKGAPREGGIFQRMKNTITNHAFEYLMEDFFLSTNGEKIFKEFCNLILEGYNIHDFQIKKMVVLKVGKDTSQVDYRKIILTEKTKYLLPNKLQTDGVLINTLKKSDIIKNTDLLVAISDGTSDYAFVGEVEGHHGESLYQPSYFSKGGGIKAYYSSFFIGASDKTKGAGNIDIKGKVSFNQLTNGRWVLNFSENHFFIKDYKTVINCMQGIIDGHFSVIENISDESHKKIINYIINGWQMNVCELLFNMRTDFALYIHGHDTYQAGTDPNSIVYRPSSDPSLKPLEHMLLQLVNIDKSSI